eukprot:5099530-Alexandrium_andersonii.AAC.1
MNYLVPSASPSTRVASLLASACAPGPAAGRLSQQTAVRACRRELRGFRLRAASNANRWSASARAQSL